MALILQIVPDSDNAAHTIDTSNPTPPVTSQPITLIATLKRKPGLTLQEFADHYFERHAALAAAVIPREVAEGITRYVQNHALALGRGDADLPFDCVTEIGFCNMKSLRRWVEWYEGPEGKVLRDDEALFMDVSARRVLVTVERVPDRPTFS